jgi:hypothetical protein
MEIKQTPNRVAPKYNLVMPCSVIPNTHELSGIEKIKKKFDLFGIQTHPIPLNPRGLRDNRTSP